MTTGDKAALRTTLRQARAALSDEVHRALDARIAANLAPLVRSEAMVGLYAPVRGEASPLPLIELTHERSVVTVFPRVVTRHPPVLAFHAARRADLVPGPFGLFEPRADAPVLGVHELDLLLLPAVAFDAALMRLGQGGGFYDAVLSSLAGRRPRPLCVAIAYELQRVARVPAEPHDRPVDLVATETGLHRAR